MSVECPVAADLLLTSLPVSGTVMLNANANVHIFLGHNKLFVITVKSLVVLFAFPSVTIPVAIGQDPCRLHVYFLL